MYGLIGIFKEVSDPCLEEGELVVVLGVGGGVFGWSVARCRQS